MSRFLRLPLGGIGVSLLCVSLLASAGLEAGDEGQVEWQAAHRELQDQLGQYSLSQLQISDAHLPKASTAMVHLGRELFFSKSLSGSYDVACASCHHPHLAGGDGLSLPVGVEAVVPDLLGPGRQHDWQASLDPKADGLPNVSRHSPTTFNSAFYRKALFDDGRVFVLPDDPNGDPNAQAYRTPDSNLWRPDSVQEDALLNVQTRFPVVATEEMLGYTFGEGLDNHGVRQGLAVRLQSLAGDGRRGSWLYLFRQAFPEITPADAAHLITFDNLQKAIGAYQQSQVLINSPWKRYLDGDSRALSVSALRGAKLFFSPAEEGGAGCVGCHLPPFFSDEDYHVLAVPQFGRGKNADGSDYGRYAVNRRPKDRYKFRTPSLLNVAETAPYGHTGSFLSLSDMVAHHLRPAESLADFDFRFTDNLQLAAYSDHLQEARSLSFAALETLQQSQQTKASKLPVFDESALQWLPDLVAFLNSLTDPCIKDDTCVAQWVPNEEDPAPDSHRLRATFSSENKPPSSSSTWNKNNKLVSQKIQSHPVAAEIFVDHCIGPVAEAATTEKIEVAKGLQFEEVSVEEGLVMPAPTDWSMYSLKNAQRLLFSGGIAAGDVNGDCLVDIFIPGGVQGIEALFINHGEDGFINESHGWGLSNLTMPLSSLSNGAAMADLDGDGRLDLLVSQLATASHVAEREDQSAPATLTRPRLLLNRDDQFVELSTSGFAAEATSWSFGVGDYDVDGDLDVFTTHWRGPGVGGRHPNHLWRNDLEQGALRFFPADKDAGLAGLIGQTDFTFTGIFSDVTRNGFPDLLVAADFESSQFYRNTGGQFQRRTDTRYINDENGMGAAVADYDNDGDFDWFVSSIWDPNGRPEGNWGVSGNRLYQNTDIAFKDVASQLNIKKGYWGWGACFADFDNDQWQDLFHVTGFDLPQPLARQFRHPAAYGQLKRTMSEFEHTPSVLFRADGDGGFDEQAQAAGIRDRASGRGVVCFDYDRDGDIDILVANHGGNPSLYRNLSRQNGQNHFLQVSLQHTGSHNHFAIGAKVTLRLGETQLIREVQAGGGYLSGGPPDVHFGVGTADVIDEVIVDWPDGGQSRFNDVTTNQMLLIKRPIP